MSALPIAQWLPRYQRSNLRFDIVAGLTVAALVVPKSLGYAGIAGVPIQNGLYAAAAAALTASAGALASAMPSTSTSSSKTPPRRCRRRWPPSTLKSKSLSSRAWLQLYR